MNISYLENVAFAKKSLVIWFSNIEQMHKGIKMFSEENTLQKEDTLFGKWYLGEGQIFSSFGSFRAIKESYDNLYSQYIEYVELYHKPIAKSFFSNQKEKRKASLDLHFEEVKQNKDKLLDLVTFFENNLKQSLLFKKDSNEKIKNQIATDQISLNPSTSKDEIFVQEKDNFVSKEFDNNLENIVRTNKTNKETNQEENIKVENKSAEIDIEEEIRRILG